MKNIIFQVNGGIGKSIMATAVCRAIKKSYPDYKLIVLTGYPEVFIGNPNVYRFYRSGMAPYLYEDFVKGDDTIFMVDEPYLAKGYLSKTKHLTEAWCDVLAIKYDGPKPDLFLNPVELNKTKIQSPTGKPVLAFQPFGGGSKEVQYSWNRDIPPHQAQALVNVLSQKYHILQFCREDQIKLQNVQHIHAPFRDMFGLIYNSQARLGIDSFMQHAAAAFDKSTTVAWITNKPVTFGYKIHKNVLPDNKLKVVNNNSVEGYIEEYDFSGHRVHDFPYDTPDVFDLNDFMKSL
jgi:ADP-heptose:LPS heptosyltransferase